LRSGTRFAAALLVETMPGGRKDGPPEEVEQAEAEGWSRAVEEVQSVADAATGTRRRRFLTPAFLDHVTALYNAAVEAGESPLLALAEAENVSYSTANKWAIAARAAKRDLKVPPRARRGRATSNSKARKR
jgi:hypothetical protein